MELCSKLDVEIQNLQIAYQNSKGPEILDERLTQLNVKAEEYKNIFMPKEAVMQQLIDLQKRLYILSAPMLPMQYDFKALEQLQNEIAQLSNFSGVDPDARHNQLEDISYILRVTKLGVKWEDKDKIIHTRNDTITELKEQLNEKDRLIQQLWQFANSDKQMILKLQQDAVNRESVLNSVRVELQQTKAADKERNKVPNMTHVSVVNHIYNKTSTLNNYAHEIPIQVGDQNILDNSEYNI